MRARRLTAWGVGLVACGLVSCARPQAPAARWAPRQFLIGVRDAPPQEPEHYAQVAKAGFGVLVDYVGPDALELARRHGLRVMVSKLGLDARTVARREGRRRAADLIARFQGHPALWGYWLGDAVRERDFAQAAGVVDLLRQHDPASPFLIGLLPCDAWAGALRTADYASYLERFVGAVSPPLLLYAHHPFREKGEGAYYFENLELASRVARARGLPFCTTVRCGLWPAMRPLGEGELRWLVYTSLAYGARGIVWAGYWRSRDGQRRGIVEADGTPTERYRWVATLNAELRALGPELLRLRLDSVAHTGRTVPIGARRLGPHGLVGRVDGGALVVAVLRGGEGGQRHLLVVNRDYRRGATAAVTLNQSCRSVAWLDPASRRWRELPARANRLETMIELPLRPGGGKLLRLTLAR